MPVVLAQVAPQRSTQYSTLAETLAPHELKLSPLGSQISDIGMTTLSGQNYLRFGLSADLDETQVRELGLLATMHAFFEFHERIGEVEGPFLRPIDASFAPRLPPTLVSARRYRGKTNELFTHFLCNVARFSSALAHRPWSTLRVFDPLAGGGTTLFVALTLGADAAGVERNPQDVESTAAFLRNFAREQGIAAREKQERLKRIGRRWAFTVGKEPRQVCLLACGDTLQSAELISGFRPHLIVADLPYGIQHHGELVTLLSQALPVWTSLLPLSGAVAMAWESTRFPRSEMIALVQESSPLTVLNDPPYDALRHRVDRVIKRRDVLVARRTEALLRERSSE